MGLETVYRGRSTKKNCNSSRANKFVGQVMHKVKTALLPLLGVGIIGGIGYGLSQLPYIESTYNGSDTANPNRISPDTPLLNAWQTYLSGMAANHTALSSKLATTCAGQRTDLSWVVSSFCYINDIVTGKDAEPANLAKQ